MATEIENGAITFEQAREVMDEFAAVNLDEIVPESLKVTFREFTPDGEVKTSTKQIRTWVPMFLFHRMLANQKKMNKLKQRQRTMLPIEDKEDEAFDLLAEDEPFDPANLSDEAFDAILRESEPALVWQSREVLNVWRMTPGEREMTLKRLVLGLGFDQIEGLFSRFFGALLRRKAGRA